MLQVGYGLNGGDDELVVRAVEAGGEWVEGGECLQVAKRFGGGDADGGVCVFEGFD